MAVNKKKSEFEARSLQQKVLRFIRQHELTNKKLYIMTSGGVDSVVLVHVLSLWRSHLNLDLTLLHVRHGSSTYQKKAQVFVKKLAQKYGLPFLTNSNVPSRKLKSESEWRDYRWRVAYKTASKSQKSFIFLTAHHRDDYLETLLLRLIRGTGPQGLISFSAFVKDKARPLLECSRSEIENYAKFMKLRWVQDPTNRVDKHLRNWLRQNWLAPLEKKSKGSTQSLCRSLLLIVEHLRPEPLKTAPLQPILSSESESRVQRKDKLAIRLQRKTFFDLDFFEKRNYLARLMLESGIKNYTQKHIDEVMKRLDVRGQRNQKFKMLNCIWSIEA